MNQLFHEFRVRKDDLQIAGFIGRWLISIDNITYGGWFAMIILQLHQEIGKPKRKSIEYNVNSM